MHSVTNHPTRPVIASTLSTQRDGLPESTLMGSPGVSGLDFTTDEMARRIVRPNRVRRYPTDCMFASGCSPPRLTTTQLPSATGSGHLPEGSFTPKARLLGGALIPAALLSRDPFSVEARGLKINWVPAQKRCREDEVFRAGDTACFSFMATIVLSQKVTKLRSLPSVLEY